MESEAAPGHTAVRYWRSGSAGSRLASSDVDADLVSSALLLHVTGITAVISASARDAVGAAIDAAAEADVPVSFDVNHRPSLAGDGSATAIANSPHPLGSSSPGATRVRCLWETAPTKRSFAASPRSARQRSP